MMDICNKSNKRKDGKTEIITIRATKNEKKKLKRKAEESGQNLSEYLICAGLGGKTCRANKKQQEICNTALLQELCNYVEEKYGENKFLDEWSEKLWNSL